MLVEACAWSGMHWRHRGAEHPYSSCQHNIAYLASMAGGEQEVLARSAYLDLADGWWAGADSNLGGHADVFEDRAEAQGGVRRFIEDCQRGNWCLNEGFIAEYANDLAGELRLLRGWCIHAPWDKHRADDAGNPIAAAAESVADALRRVRWTWL
ncbi:MAG: hypothetical protein HYX53_14815 [Chloroflexi bacterium]|nr:hypothetical protein [Chloroflexota bacterium]